MRCDTTSEDRIRRTARYGYWLHLICSWKVTSSMLCSRPGGHSEADVIALSDGFNGTIRKPT